MLELLLLHALSGQSWQDANPKRRLQSHGSSLQACNCVHAWRLVLPDSSLAPHRSGVLTLLLGGSGRTCVRWVQRRMARVLPGSRPTCRTSYLMQTVACALAGEAECASGCGSVLPSTSMHWCEALMIGVLLLTAHVATDFRITCKLIQA